MRCVGREFLASGVHIGSVSVVIVAFGSDNCRGYLVVAAVALAVW